ncbi:MAG TPA: response regulator transcription factor [Candidatus Acidoferrum sp.]|jgi:DNA-binding NarL/FixJ family response regulator
MTRSEETKGGPVLRILVADDHAVVRSGLRTILNGREGWEVCAEAETGDQAVVLARKFRPDVAVLDLSMPGIGGLQAANEIKHNVPGTELVVLTCHYSGPLLQAVANAGALGFVLKSDADRDLISAVEAAHRRQRYISRYVEARLPASSSVSSSFFSLFEQSDRLTTQERSQVRMIANQMRNLL